MTRRRIANLSGKQFLEYNLIMLSERYPFYLSAMDPGGTTGLSLLRISEKNFTVESQKAVKYDPRTGESPIKTLREWRRRFLAHPHIHVYENFHLRPGRQSTDITAYGLIVALEHWIMDEDPYEVVAPQEPVAAKNLVSDTILDRLDLKAYGPDSRHINDANRHAAAWLARNGYEPLCRTAWPQVSNE